MTAQEHRRITPVAVVANVFISIGGMALIIAMLSYWGVRVDKRLDQFEQEQRVQNDKVLQLSVKQAICCPREGELGS